MNINFDKLIGNTPMIKINYSINNIKKYTYAKLESYNFTGSIKDRIVYYILKKAIKENELIPNMPIIEATSGNTGISIAAIGSALKHPVHIFMPDWVSNERKKIMEMYGAKVYLISKEDGGFKTAIKKANELSKNINGFQINQFNNKLNIEAHYTTTATEILSQIPNIDAFVSGIGSGGTIMGIAKRLKEYNYNIKISALEPDTLPILSKNQTSGQHKIEGIGDDFIPQIVDKKYIDDIILINDLDAINMSRKLANELGIGVGISSGANFLASTLIDRNNVATIFPDDNKKYISTNLANNNLYSKNTFLSNQIQLINFESI